MYDRKRIRRPHTAPPPRAIFQTDGASPVPEHGATASEHSFGRIAVTSPTSLASYREERQMLCETFTATIQRDNPKGSPLPGEVDTSIPAPAEEGAAAPLPMRGGGATEHVHSKFAFTSDLTDDLTNPPGGEYGATTYSVLPLTDRTVTAGNGVFTVTATVPLAINVKVCPGNGPHREINIDDESDPAINSANYAQVAAALTPDAKNNVPPRNHYWARDLVFKHEHFHADEDVHYGAEGRKLAQAWLNKQKVSGAGDVDTLLDQVPAYVEGHIQTKMAPPGREERAYANGAADYQARADAIKKKGDSGKYPPPSP